MQSSSCAAAASENPHFSRRSGGNHKKAPPRRRSRHTPKAAASGGVANMNSDQVALIQHSFAKIRPIAQEAAALFYGRLFEIAPDIRPLFRGDMAEQGRKLMATLAVVVNGLADLESILPAASALAKKHVSYGVRAEHYGPVGIHLATP